MAEKTENNMSPELQEINLHLEFLREERDECTDELPEKHISNYPEIYYQAKCRTNWWNGIIGRFRLLLGIEMGTGENEVVIEDPTVAEQVRQFIKFTENINFKEYRTANEIKRADEAITVVINYLKKRAMKAM